MNQDFWRKCIVCKKEINFSSKYYKCSVVSCDKKRAPAQFCTVDCWDVHRSIMSHKSAGADEYHSPTKEQWLRDNENTSKVRIVTPKKSLGSTELNLDAANTEEILVVVSKMKNYIKEISNLNTSADVFPVLSDILRSSCEEAIKNARNDERKTLMARDFKK